MKDYFKATPTIREKRIAEYEEIPEAHRPRCSVCNSIIPFDGSVHIKRHLSRTCCSVYAPTPASGIKCFAVKVKASNAARYAAPKPRNPVIKPGPHRKKKIEVAPKKDKRPQAEIDRLEAEQAEINKKCWARTMEHCGYCNSPARRLTREEIDRIAPTLVPPSNVSRAYNPHFRQELSRRGMEL